MATGDKFINSQKIINNYQKKLIILLLLRWRVDPLLKYVFKKTFLDCTRVISDNANEEASEKFEDFLKKYNKSSAILISFLLEEIANKI